MQQRHLGITDLDVISHASLLYLNACIKNVIGRNTEDRRNHGSCPVS